MSIKINELTIENVKRIKAVRIEPSESGLTVIGGRNNQGKTSVIDAIAWALGGDKYRPSQANRDGSTVPPHLNIKLSNGLVVERKGKNGDLKVTDPNGSKGGQQLLNEFVEQLAIDLPRFIQASDKEKAAALLKIIGVGDRLTELEYKEKTLYNRRLEIGRIADQKAKFAREMPYYTDAPENPVSVSELLNRHQAILAKNGENQRLRQRRAELEQQAASLKSQLASIQRRYNEAMADLAIASKAVEDLIDESTAEIEDNIRNVERLNIKVRANLDKQKAEDDAKEFADQYSQLSDEIDKCRAAKTELLKGADLPLEGLTVEDGCLLYNGKHWDNMSGSDQLKVATAIVRKLNPKCGFVLVDKLEQMDIDTLNDFGRWLESEGLQAIATRVSTGDECSIIIEDGYVKSSEAATLQPQKTWKEGEF